MSSICSSNEIIIRDAHCFPKVFESNNNFINKLFKMKPADIKFVETNFMNLNESATIMDSNKIEVKDVIDLIKDYIDGTDYDRKDDLKAFFIDLYREAAAESEKL